MIVRTIGGKEVILDRLTPVNHYSDTTGTVGTIGGSVRRKRATYAWVPRISLENKPLKLFLTLKLAFVLHVGISTLSRLQPEPSRGTVTPKAKDGRPFDAALPWTFFYTHCCPVYIPYFYLQRPPSPACIAWPPTSSHVRKHSTCQSRLYFSSSRSTDPSVLHTILSITAKPTSLWAQQECTLGYSQSQHPESTFVGSLCRSITHERKPSASFIPADDPEKFPVIAIARPSQNFEEEMMAHKRNRDLGRSVSDSTVPSQASTTVDDGRYGKRMQRLCLCWL